MDGRGPVTGGYVRVNLPPELAERYTPERDLGSGGEADVLLVRDRQTSEQVVMRIYRRADIAVDTHKLDMLRQADATHVIRLIDWGRGPTCIWEKLEYAAAGSLEDLRRATPGPWELPHVWTVLTQLAPAIAYAHSLRMVHRDIKPGNILVRSTGPVDLVLADFGLARMLAASREMRTSSRTSAYAAPEAASGDTSTALDWWSLGIVLVELITGRNPFQRPDGTWQNEVMIVRELTVHDIDLSAIKDERWRLLLRGLLTRAPEDRWGADQVDRWCRGEQPTVAVARGPVYAFAGAAFTDPVALAEAFQQHWPDARRVFAGQQVGAPQFLAFRDWATKLALADVLRVLGQPDRPDRMVTRVVHALDPDSPPTFCQGPLDQASLVRLATDAAAQPAGVASNVIDLVYNDGILPVLDGRPGCDGYAVLDSRWRRLWEEFERRIVALRLPLPAETTRWSRAVLLVAAFPGQETLLAREASEAVRDEHSLAQPWFHQLAVENVTSDLAPAYHAAIVTAAPVAAEQTHQGRMQAETAAREAARQQVFQKQRSMDDISAALGLICGIASCIPLLGIVAGPAAIYFGYRARRGGHRGLSNAAFALGILGILAFFCSLPTLGAEQG